MKRVKEVQERRVRLPQPQVLRSYYTTKENAMSPILLSQISLNKYAKFQLHRQAVRHFKL